MELINSKHSKLVINLEVGEVVKSQIEKKDIYYIIKDIQIKKNCESGIIVKLDKYPYYIDSNWIIKLIK